MSCADYSNRLTCRTGKYHYVNTSCINVAQPWGEAGRLGCNPVQMGDGPTSLFAPCSNGVANDPLGSLAQDNWLHSRSYESVMGTSNETKYRENHHMTLKFL